VKSSALSYRSDIDGLRAVAVLAVVLHHLSAPLVPGGYVGVDVFFVISGFLITQIIGREMDQGAFTFAGFYERRIRRIFPALFVVLIVTLISGYIFLLPSDYRATLRAAIGTVFFVSNVVFWRDTAAGYFAATDATLNPLLHTWSLAVEEQFYLLFPLLLLFCMRYLRRHTNVILFVCTLVSLAGAILFVNSKSVAVFFLSPFRGWELLVGAILALNALPLFASRVVREFVVTAGLSAILCAGFLYSSETTFPGFTALAPVLGAAAIIHAGSSGVTTVGLLLRNRFAVGIGLISYSLYLWHWPLIVFTKYASGLEPLSWQSLVAVFCVSLIVASISYRFIEQPFRRGHGLSRRTVFMASAMFAIVLTSVSVLGLMRAGWEERFDRSVVALDAARTPVIPFLQCEERKPNDWCTLGIPDLTPNVLLWGDSHLLAFAPALDLVLKKHRGSALFAEMSACPPVRAAAISAKGNCDQHNLAVEKHLLEHPEITTVVMSAHWRKYLQDDVLTAEVGTSSTAALVSTLHWLRDKGKRVVLIGPVPVFDRNVPLTLALQASTTQNLLRVDAETQRRNQAAFFRAVAEFSTENWFALLDPIEWLCRTQCATMEEGTVLYRDSNHLSVQGALRLMPYIEDKLVSFAFENCSPRRRASCALEPIKVTDTPVPAARDPNQ
jgi:peptidoglycan/LPS O-acetylase OafA/YrhL